MLLLEFVLISEFIETSRNVEPEKSYCILSVGVGCTFGHQVVWRPSTKDEGSHLMSLSFT
jgi:hypothetical protein